VKIAYDAKLKRPGCVLLQATLGCAEPNLAGLFPVNSWLLAPTPDLRAYPVTDAQLLKLIRMAKLMDEDGQFE
jgi:hypothetical protein